MILILVGFSNFCLSREADHRNIVDKTHRLKIPTKPKYKDNYVPFKRELHFSVLSCIYTRLDRHILLSRWQTYRTTATTKTTHTNTNHSVRNQHTSKVFVSFDTVIMRTNATWHSFMEYRQY